MALRHEFDEGKSPWMVTFADLVTLLLALFVLIFSMSSLDSAIIRTISSSVSRDLPKRDLNWGEITEDIREIAQLVLESQSVHQHEGRIKELLFPRDLLPPDIDKGTLDSSFRVEDRADGVAFVLGDALLFEGASSRISDNGRLILASMGPLLEAIPGEIRIIAFYDGPTTSDLPDDYAVAGRHALATLGVFLNRGVDAGRLSVSAYGAGRARESLDDGPVISRVEILFKAGRSLIHRDDGGNF